MSASDGLPFSQGSSFICQRTSSDGEVTIFKRRWIVKFRGTRPDGGMPDIGARSVSFTPVPASRADCGSGGGPRISMGCPFFGEEGAACQGKWVEGKGGCMENLHEEGERKGGSDSWPFFSFCPSFSSHSYIRRFRINSCMDDGLRQGALWGLPARGFQRRKAGKGELGFDGDAARKNVDPRRPSWPRVIGKREKEGRKISL